MDFPRPKEYPPWISVKGMPWDIKFVAKCPGCHKTDLGLCDPETRTIYIRKGQSRKEYFKTFLHELLHAVDEEWCVWIPHKIINRLEAAGAAFLYENIDVIANFAWLMLSELNGPTDSKAGPSNRRSP